MDDPIIDLFAESKNPPKPLKKPSGKIDVPRVVDEELSNLGWSPNARLSMLGNLGRENAWNPNTIFQGHKDPKNAANNLGIISWQGDRRNKLINYLQKNGGDLTPSENNLRLMTRFMDDEIKSSKEWSDIHQKVRNPNISTKEASQLFRRYIKYVPNAPYNTPDDEFDTKNNRQWAEKAQKLGLGKTQQQIIDLFAESKDFQPQDAPLDLFAESNAADPTPNGFQSEPNADYMAQFYKNDGIELPPNPRYEVKTPEPIAPPARIGDPLPKAEIANNPIETNYNEWLSYQANRPDSNEARNEYNQLMQGSVNEANRLNARSVNRSVPTQIQQPNQPNIVQKRQSQTVINQPQDFQDKEVNIEISKGDDVRARLKEATRQTLQGYGFDPADIEDAIDANQVKFGDGTQALDSKLQEIAKDGGTITHRVLADVFRDAQRIGQKRKAITERVKNGESELDARFNEGLLTPEQYQSAKNELAQIEAKEKEARAKYEQENRKIVNEQADFGGSFEGQGVPYVPQDELQKQADARFEAEKQDIIQKYGSFAKYFQEKDRIEKEYGTLTNPNPYRPMARQAEVIKSLASTVPDAVASIAKTVDILGEVSSFSPQNIYSILANGTKFEANKGDLYQFGDAISKRLDKAQNKDLQFSATDRMLTTIAPKALGQMAIQLGLGALTGGATAPVLLGSSMGMAEQYDEAVKKGATPDQRRIAALIGGVAAISDAVPFAKFLSPLNKAGKISWINKYLGSLFTKTAQEVGEEAAVEITKGAFSRLIKNSKTVLTGALLEGTQELSEKKINDFVASLTYDPTRKVLTLSNEDIENFLGGAIGGTAGGGFQVSLENHTPQDDEETFEFAENLLSENQSVPSPLTPDEVEAKIAEVNQNLAKDKFTKERVPETPQTIQAQIEAIGKGQREVVVLPPNLNGELIQIPKLPENLATIETKDGTVIFDPTKQTAEEVQAKAEKGKLFKEQGIVDKESPQTTQAVIAKDEQGNELQSVYVKPENVQQQTDKLKEQFPNANIEVKSAEEAEAEIIPKRLDEAKTEIQQVPPLVDKAENISTPKVESKSLEQIGDSALIKSTKSLEQDKDSALIRTPKAVERLSPEKKAQIKSLFKPKVQEVKEAPTTETVVEETQPTETEIQRDAEIKEAKTPTYSLAVLDENRITHKAKMDVPFKKTVMNSKGLTSQKTTTLRQEQTAFTKKTDILNQLVRCNNG